WSIVSLGPGRQTGGSHSTASGSRDLFPAAEVLRAPTCNDPGWRCLMEFVDVVMKRRAVRRFEEGGVERDVIERIARLAQRSPSAGFSQGQRLVVVTEPERRREVARICGEEFYADVFGPWISECAAQFVPCVSEDIYHRRYQEPDKIDEDGKEIDWPVPYWFVDVGGTMQTIWLAAVNEGLGCGFVGTDDLYALNAALGIPAEFTPIGV